jgi:predicted O-methyltransferase YrrM
MLEIGCWEGRSTLYWLQTLHKESTITVIDSFEGGAEHDGMKQLSSLQDTFCTNISAYKDRVNVLKGYSQYKLFKLDPLSFDIVYVDGSHTSWDALTDIIMSFHLLKVGGIMMIDDYGGGREDPKKILENSPAPAVDSFFKIFAKFIRLIYTGYQVHLLKIANTDE